MGYGLAWYGNSQPKMGIFGKTGGFRSTLYPKMYPNNCDGVLNTGESHIGMP